MYFPQIPSCKNLWRSFYDVPRYTKDCCLSCFLSVSPLTRKQKHMIPEPSELERPFLLTSSNDFSFSPLTLTLTHTYPCFIPISCNTLPHSLSQQHDNLQTNPSLPIIMSKSPHHTNPPSPTNITSFPTEGYDVRHPRNLMHCSTPHWQNHWLQRLLIWKWTCPPLHLGFFHCCCHHHHQWWCLPQEAPNLMTKCGTTTTARCHKPSPSVIWFLGWATPPGLPFALITFETWFFKTSMPG